MGAVNGDEGEPGSEFGRLSKQLCQVTILSA